MVVEAADTYGTRVVSHQFDMADWQPEKTLTLNGHTVNFWRIPQHANASTAIGKDTRARVGNFSLSRDKIRGLAPVDKPPSAVSFLTKTRCAG